MQRQDPDGIVIMCDFCHRDWDGQEAMIEGHHGSVICLTCLNRAAKEKSAGAEKFSCTLCLRYNMPQKMPRWHNPQHPDAIICNECIEQATKAFAKKGFAAN